MKLSYVFLITGIAGFSFGLVADALAHSENSKVLSLAKTGQFDSEWISINLDNEVFQVTSFTQSFPFGGGPYYFIESAYLLEDADNVFEHAKIDFKMSKEQKPDGTYDNRVTDCIFETDVNVNTNCVVCLLRDGNGINIAKGEQFFESPYQANTPLSLTMTEFLFDDQDITDARNVKGIQIGICKDNSEES